MIKTDEQTIKEINLVVERLIKQPFKNSLNDQM